MKKLTPEQRIDRIKHRRQKILDAKPILGMAHYEMKSVNATVKMQVIGITKHSVTMKTISGRGTLTLSTTNGQSIGDIIKIDLIPCSLVPTLTKDGITKEIPQGTECGL